jgi:hypothetical protein
MITAIIDVGFYPVAYAVLGVLRQRLRGQEGYARSITCIRITTVTSSTGLRALQSS